MISGLDTLTVYIGQSPVIIVTSLNYLFIWTISTGEYRECGRFELGDPGYVCDSSGEVFYKSPYVN